MKIIHNRTIENVRRLTEKRGVETDPKDVATVEEGATNAVFNALCELIVNGSTGDGGVQGLEGGLNGSHLD